MYLVTHSFDWLEPEGPVSHLFEDAASAIFEAFSSMLVEPLENDDENKQELNSWLCGIHGATGFNGYWRHKVLGAPIGIRIQEAILGLKMGGQVHLWKEKAAHWDAGPVDETSEEVIVIKRICFTPSPALYKLRYAKHNETEVRSFTGSEFDCHAQIECMETNTMDGDPLGFPRPTPCPKKWPALAGMLNKD